MFQHVYFIYMNIVVMLLIPFLSLVALNAALCRAVKRSTIAINLKVNLYFLPTNINYLLFNSLFPLLVHLVPFFRSHFSDLIFTILITYSFYFIYCLSHYFLYCIMLLLICNYFLAKLFLNNLFYFSSSDFHILVLSSTLISHAIYLILKHNN